MTKQTLPCCVQKSRQGTVRFLRSQRYTCLDKPASEGPGVAAQSGPFHPSPSTQRPPDCRGPSGRGTTVCREGGREGGKFALWIQPKWLPAQCAPRLSPFPSLAEKPLCSVPPEQKARGAEGGDGLPPPVRCQGHFMPPPLFCSRAGSCQLLRALSRQQHKAACSGPGARPLPPPPRVPFLANRGLLPDGPNPSSLQTKSTGPKDGRGNGKEQKGLPPYTFRSLLSRRLTNAAPDLQVN